MVTRNAILIINIPSPDSENVVIQQNFVSLGERMIKRMKSIPDFDNFDDDGQGDSVAGGSEPVGSEPSDTETQDEDESFDEKTPGRYEMQFYDQYGAANKIVYKKG